MTLSAAVPQSTPQSALLRWLFGSETLVVGALSVGEITVEAGQYALHTLPQQEQDLVARSVAQRQYAFAVTRHLAHQILSCVGHSHWVVDKDSQGAPLWPPGVVGALTHCQGMQATVISTTAAGIGLDAEPARALPLDVLATIAQPDEIEQLAQLKTSFPPDIVLFSAKETLYKVWYPLTGAWLGFHDAHIDLTVLPAADLPRYIEAGGTFRAQVSNGVLDTAHLSPYHSAQLADATGRWCIYQGIVVTALVLPPEVSAEPTKHHLVDQESS